MENDEGTRIEKVILQHGRKPVKRGGSRKILPPFWQESIDRMADYILPWEHTGILMYGMFEEQAFCLCKALHKCCMVKGILE